MSKEELLRHRPELGGLLRAPLLERLRHVSQLGAGVAAFPCATHSRYEHSVGTAVLAHEACRRLGNYLTSTESLCVVVAALLHDVGHGPLSHTFDTLLRVANLMETHEERGARLVQELVREVPDVVQVMKPQDWKFVEELIRGKCPHLLAQSILSAQGPDFLDVDRLDYLPRDTKAVRPDHADIVSEEQALAAVRECTVVDGRWHVPESTLEVFVEQRRWFLTQITSSARVTAAEKKLTDRLRLCLCDENWLKMALNHSSKWLMLTDGALLARLGPFSPAPTGPTGPAHVLLQQAETLRKNAGTGSQGVETEARVGSYDDRGRFTPGVSEPVFDHMLRERCNCPAPLVWQKCSVWAVGANRWICEGGAVPRCETKQKALPPVEISCDDAGPLYTMPCIGRMQVSLEGLPPSAPRPPQAAPTYSYERHSCKQKSEALEYTLDFTRRTMYGRPCKVSFEIELDITRTNVPSLPEMEEFVREGHRLFYQVGVFSTMQSS